MTTIVQVFITPETRLVVQDVTTPPHPGGTIRVEVDSGAIALHYSDAPTKTRILRALKGLVEDLP